MLEQTLFIGTGSNDPIPLPFDRLVELHSELRDATAEIMHREHDFPAELSSFVAIQSFVYAFNAYKAIGLLLPELYHEHATVILRQLWEVSLNLHWIERDPVVRAQDFCNFTIMEYRKVGKLLGREDELSDFDKASAQFQKRFRYRDRKGRDQKHTVFATKSVCDRAVELGDPWKREYELVYHLASQHMHGSPRAILHAFFKQQYSSPETRERNMVSVVSILSMRLLIRDLHLLARLGFIGDSKAADSVFESVGKLLDNL